MESTLNIAHGEARRTGWAQVPEEMSITWLFPIDDHATPPVSRYFGNALHIPVVACISNPVISPAKNLFIKIPNQNHTLHSGVLTERLQNVDPAKGMVLDVELPGIVGLRMTSSGGKPCSMRLPSRAASGGRLSIHQNRLLTPSATTKPCWRSVIPMPNKLKWVRE